MYTKKSVFKKYTDTLDTPMAKIVDTFENIQGLQPQPEKVIYYKMGCILLHVWICDRVLKYTMLQIFKMSILYYKLIAISPL